MEADSFGSLVITYQSTRRHTPNTLVLTPLTLWPQFKTAASLWPLFKIGVIFI
jgi:hypothetical protein